MRKEKHYKLALSLLQKRHDQILAHASSKVRTADIYHRQGKYEQAKQLKEEVKAMDKRMDTLNESIKYFKGGGEQ